MIFPSNFEDKIGFSRIRELLLKECLSPLGIGHVNRMRFNNQPLLVRKLIAQLDEFKRILLEKSAFPQQDYIDMKAELIRIRTEGTYIEQEKLKDLFVSLSTIEEALEYIHKLDEEEFPNLIELSKDIFLIPGLLDRIMQIIDEKGEIKDNASEKLKQIRSDIRKHQADINKRIREKLQTSKQKGWIKDDADITIRNGRTVIPFPASNKRKIKGFVHDESASGQTVYIEPAEIFETNNTIRILEGEERREIINILKNFTDFIRPEVEPLLQAYKWLGTIDFIRAKAKFSIKINAIAPTIKSYPHIYWEEATHPLLMLSLKAQKKPIVPLNIHLDTKKRILIISGPNAGGKSICLKTVGLLQYMLQCGLLIPLRENSQCGIFQRLFIDIGDEQSLDNDLSTYSSHLLNIKYFINGCNSRSLFLIDEFGTGTDPQLGGAIAEAALEKLNEKKGFGLVTTHYSNLKLLAGRLKGVFNGAMLFDNKNMQPLFQLKTGKPGSSYAFEIAKKIGLPEDVLENAAKKTGRTQLDFDTQLVELEAEKKQLQKKKTELQIADGFLAEMVDKYEKLQEDLQKRKNEIIQEAKLEALELLENSNKLIENTIKDIRESQAEKEKTKKLRQKLISSKKVLEASANKKEEKPKKIKDKEEKPFQPPSRPLKPGDWVKINQQSLGEIIEIRNNEAIVASDNLKLRIDLKKLKHAQAPSKKRAPQTRLLNEDYNEKVSRFSLSLDLRGYRAEEALDALKKYLDEASLLSIAEVTIIHGKGDGILREVVRDHLKNTPIVSSYRDERLELGGHGVSVVSLK